MNIFKRRPLDERLKLATVKALERDLHIGVSLEDRDVMAVAWSSENGGDMDVTIRFGPNIRARTARVTERYAGGIDQ